MLLTFTFWGPRRIIFTHQMVDLSVSWVSWENEIDNQWRMTKNPSQNERRGSSSWALETPTQITRSALARNNQGSRKEPIGTNQMSLMRVGEETYKFVTTVAKLFARINQSVAFTELNEIVCSFCGDTHSSLLCCQLILRGDWLLEKERNVLGNPIKTSSRLLRAN